MLVPSNSEFLSVPFIVTISLIVLVALSIVLAICLCYETATPAALHHVKSTGIPEAKAWRPHNAPTANNSNHVVDLNEDARPNGTIVTSSNHQRDSNNSRSSQATTLARQLPDLPFGNVSPKVGQGHVNKVPGKDDGYDHLHMPQSSPSKISPGYDHCQQSSIEDITKVVSKTGQNRENIYNLPMGESSDSGSGVLTKDTIREPIYELLSGETSDSGSGMIAGRENVYNEPEDQTVYRKTFKKSSSSTPTIENIRESEYTLVSELNIDYSQLGAAMSSPSSRSSKVDKHEHDPYTVINIDQQLFLENEARRSEPTHIDLMTDSEYATVAKVSNRNTSDIQAMVDSSPSSPEAPPLPGRQYADEEVASLRDQSLQNSPDVVIANMFAHEAMDLTPAPSDETTEVSYTEVTARECLASIQARQKDKLASQSRHEKQDSTSTTYEAVVENYYATVDGSSGDGIISPKKTLLDPTHRNSDISETYTEIHVSGESTKDITISSTDTVNGMVYHGSSADSSTNSQTYSEVNRISLSTVIESPKMPKNENIRPHTVNITSRRVVKSTPAPLASAESDDLASESHRQMRYFMDPNYESLDDVQLDARGMSSSNLDLVAGPSHAVNNTSERSKERRTKSLGHHAYEEITGRSSVSRPECADDVRTRVLNNHVYEAVTEPI